MQSSSNTVPFVKKVGFPSLVYADPLCAAVQEHSSLFSTTRSTPTQLALQLREKSLHCGVISPLEYARQASGYRIIPNVGVCSNEGASVVRMHFNKGLHGITTLAADPNFSSEIVLASILLAENYDTFPKIIPAQGNAHALLEKADAALVVGDKNISDEDKMESLDLVELWQDMFEIPFVYGVLASPEDSLTLEEIQTLASSGTHAQEKIKSEDEHRFYLSHFSYTLSDEEIEGMKEFFRLAYYYHFINDIPDEKFHSLNVSPLLTKHVFQN
ncbi:MAG: MqnA/MqnD/SBP family protein [Bacteroidota bacterium]